MNLRIPGPTPCPPEVLQAMSREMINHRGPAFARIIEKVTARLKELFLTQSEVLVLTGSGTGGLEAMVVNTLSPGDEVLGLTNGYFGERLAAIAQDFGAKITRLDFPWGEPVDPGEVRQALKKNPNYKAVLLVHNETSTGVTNDLKGIAEIVREHDKLFLVDAVSSLGSLPCCMDAWGLDVVVTCSQKGWMAPPGLAMVGISSRGWKAVEQAKMPRHYWDFRTAKQYLARGQTSWTPAVSTFFALEVGLELMAREGLENIWERHRRVGQRAREGAKALGLSPLPPEPVASNTVTAIRAPEGLDVARLVKILLEEYDTDLAGGQGKLSGKIFRIGHLGYVTEADIDLTLKAIAKALPRAGYAIPQGLR
ncbi:MAG: alanine--glyoxylate aminotransferase family protein [Chloroflexi bacterium]|nr:alanine--glyoxylate aminotransferase family protein [Chloroflexota bacterium]